ncbi:tyrosine-type recombinase/integrase [Vibrio cyclitrophicus]|uniref:tyrosine-type recombinase/integrase n=1 Tax=Vibrio cyclitrophicus TaxID=47951 RepID=UPI0007EEC258|nr:tyrosine-type recombinase/integrase [Vibrio cyclitrophicus]OBT04971.1 integrase [Vibrio cyclitrophicus]PMI48195.1 integrase [Vibrio cyclitrophicus]
MPVKYFEDFERWDFFSPLDNKLKMVNASGTPFITYKDGLPCYEANMYINNQLRNNRRASTLKTYAKQIHHIIHYCYKNGIKLTQLSNDHFRVFVNGLQAERDKFGELVRANNTTRDIAHRCIDFLYFIKSYHDLENFIGTGKENSIQVKIKKYYRTVEGAKQKQEYTQKSHQSIPSQDALKRRLPVSENDALKVWDYIHTQKNREKRYRDIALYQCLEQLGGRISEITLITMSDINNSLQSGDNPSLRLTTLKRRDDSDIRSIPVTLALLTSIKQYINKTRKKVIKRTLGKDNDHDFLFVSLTTGKPLQSSTLTSYMNKWKKELGIEGELHPHLFRHAFITNKLKEIILAHKDITSADNFREHLLHTERFKMQLKEWTGHTHISSLDTYINLVFADLNGYSEVYNAVQLKDSVTVVKQQIQHIKQQLKDKSITMTEGLYWIDETLTAFERDIENSMKK